MSFPEQEKTVMKKYRQWLDVSLSVLFAAIFLLSVSYILHSTFAFIGPQQGAGSGQGAIAVDASNNVAVGTSTPNGAARLVIAASSTNATDYSLKILQPNGTPIFSVSNNGSASSTQLCLGGSCISAWSSSQWTTSSTAIYYNTGNVGIGTTNPLRPLEISKNAAGASMVGVRYTDTGTGGKSWEVGTNQQVAGDFGIYSVSNSTQRLLILDNGNVGIGTTVPQAKLHVSLDGSTPASALVSTLDSLVLSNTAVNRVRILVASDTDVVGQYAVVRARGTLASPTIVSNGDQILELAAQGYDGSARRNAAAIRMFVDGGTPSATSMPGSIRFLTTPVGGTDVTEKMRIDSTGNVSIGTATSTTLSVGGGGGKITAGTYDPLYTIGGVNYATYLPGMTGVKEETTGVVRCEVRGARCEAIIDFNAAEQGSDLWLFAKATNFKNNFDAMIVLLTPSFDGNVWYEKDVANNRLTIYAAPSTTYYLPPTTYEVSYRLTAPRFDAAQWPNISSEKGTGLVPDGSSQ
jgi:hypothetical protein